MTQVANIAIGLQLDGAAFEAGASRARSALRGSTESMQGDLRRLEGVFGRFEGAAVGSFQNVERRAGGMSRATGAALGNVGFQVQDMIVQLQGGTQALTVFVQQGTQIAGAFGPVGAIVGAVAAALAIGAKALFGFNEEAAKSPDVLDSFVAGMDRAEQRARSYAEALSQAQGATATLLRQSANVERTGLQEVASQNVDSLVEQLRGRLIQKVYERSQAGEFFEGANAGKPGAGILARQAAVDEANAVAEQLKAAAGAGNQAALDKILAKLNLGTRETEEFTKALRDAAAQIAGLNQAEESADARRAKSPRGGRPFLEGPAPGKVSPLSLYPERTPEDERLRNQTLRQIETDEQNRQKKLVAGIRTVQEAREKASADALAQLKREGEATEHLTDAVANLHKVIRERPGGSSLDSNILNTEASNRTTLGGRPYSTLDQRILTTERSNRDSAKKILADQIKDQEEQTRKLADLQSDILIEPWRRMADEVAGIADGMFADLLNKGEISGDALGESFTKGINASLANLGSTLVTAPLQKAIAEIGSGQYSGLGDFTQKNPGLVYGTAGLVAGQVGGQVLGLQGKYGGLGGTVGALAGGALFGPFGAAAGGFLGSIAGGLFGAENNLGNDRSTEVYKGNKGKIVYSDKSFSAGNRSVTSGILGQVGDLQEALGDLGATFKDFKLEVAAGNKSGITVNGKKYDTADAALRGAIETLLKARTGGLTQTQQTILGSTKGKNAAEIGQDLAFGETYDRLVAGGNQYDRALKDLNQTYDQAIVQAQKLKLDTAGLVAARERETAEINRQRDQATRGVRSQLASLSGNNGLRQQLLDLETQMRELAKAALDLGIPLDEVTKAHEEAAKRIIEAWQQNLQNLVRQQRDAAQGIVEAQRATVGAVDQFLDPIKQALGSQGIGRGVYSGVATTNTALDEFRTMLQAAQSGDVKALSGLAGAGQAAVQAARETYGSGAEFAKIYQEIEAGLKAEQGELEAKRDQVLREIGAFSEQTVDELIRLRKETLEQQRELFAQLGRDIAAAIEGAR